ncbi:MAG: D-alanyl-D-alanine carboxypeptidase/D-alanyl-D-alanine-endopeptidase [Myxococcota bacterium]
MLRASLVVLLVLLAPRLGAAQDPDIRSRLREVVVAADLGDRIGIHVVDLRTGREIFSQRKDLALNPASNMKLVTAALALERLGPTFRMRTGLYGRVERGRVDPLVVRGYGDPSLQHSDLVQLGEALRDRGVRRVGRVIVDGSYFDDQFLPPAFEQQPNEIAAFRAAISAFAVERSAFVLRVLPGSAVGRPARVRLMAPDYFALDSELETVDGGEPDVIAVQRGDGDQMSLRLRGRVPLGILGISYRRRVENPVSYAGHALRHALTRAEIQVGALATTGAPSGLPLLTSRQSPPVAELIFALGKNSDNFTAEMLLKVVGAEVSRPGSSAEGAAAATAYLRELGVPEGFTIVNGSGLFDGNQIAASHLTRLLQHMYENEGLRPEYLAHLAIAGRDGTLRRRLRDLPAPGIVRAKTGTLNDVIALSGYVLGPDDDHAYAFSILCNGIRGKQGQARRLADDLVRQLANELH